MTHHPYSLTLQPFDHASVLELAEHAKRLGIQFKINGIPFGAPYDKQKWDAFNVKEGLAALPCGWDEAHEADGRSSVEKAS